MATFEGMFSTLVFVSLAISVSADAFLQAQRDRITKQDVDRTFLSELHDAGRAAELQSVEEELRPVYAALPKSERGKLEPATVRYALHRYFVQKHGWQMAGLEPEAEAMNSSASGSIMKNRAPVYIQNLFEQHLHGEGLGLHELAIFVATLTDLVHREAAGDVHTVFQALQLPTAGNVERRSFEYGVKAYLLSHFSKHFPEGKTGYVSLERRISSIYPAWEDTLAWAQDLQQSHSLHQRSCRNPFVEREHGFDEAVALVHEIKHSFGPFQNIECTVLKERLLEMEDGGSGRVPLSRFYADAIHGDWTFMESVGYLRSLGALDETDSQRPTVIIPNYINSPANCLLSSGFYSVCCRDGCEGLLRHLEWEIAAPSAAPEKIVDIVSTLPSETVVAPRNLSTSLLARLSEIAAFHGGHVPLHGRLFSQWMHHAYPRECPFPHVSGTTKPMTMEQFVEVHGMEALDATEDEMLRHTSSHVDAVAMTSLPWTLEEELVAERGRLAEPSQWCLVSLRALMAFMALASFAVPLVRASKALPENKCEKYLV